MPKKSAPPTVEQAKKRIERAIRRHVEAQVQRAIAGVVTRGERLTMTHLIQDTAVQITWAIQDFEMVVRANPYPPLSPAMVERCTFVEHDPED